MSWCKFNSTFKFYAGENMNFLLENTNLQSENVDAKSFNLCRSMNTVITIRFYLTVNKMGRVTYLEGCIHCRELQEKNEYRYNITQKPTKLKQRTHVDQGRY